MKATLSAATLAASAPAQDRLLTENETAAILNVRPQTLSVWRLRGQGPRFSKIGKLVRYKLSTVLAYVDERECENTAQAEQLDD